MRKRCTEYYGDIPTSCSLEFLAIEVTDVGWSGTWRVIHPDGTAKEAPFSFAQDGERGVYIITSEAFPSYITYESKAFTSEDVRTY